MNASALLASRRFLPLFLSRFRGGASEAQRPESSERIRPETTSAALSRDALIGAARTRGASEIAIPHNLLRIGAVPLPGTDKTDYPAVMGIAANITAGTAAREPS